VKRNILLLSLLFSASLVGLPEVLIISDRAHFDDPDRLSFNQIKRYISIKTPTSPREVHGIGWEHRIEQKRVAFLIHGYNNTYEDALDFFTKIINNTHKQYDQFICYLWPGGDDFWEYDQARFIVTGEILPRRLSSVLKKVSSHARNTDVIAHSMGCRLILEALKLPCSSKIGNLFMLAPAVDDESIDKGEKYAQAIQKTDRTYVFYSRADPVENLVYPIAEWDLALGGHGPDDKELLPKKVKCIDCSNCVQNHSDYVSTSFVYQIISSAAEKR
jgi:esterase/lipase superfamily enzyme